MAMARVTGGTARRTYHDADARPMTIIRVRADRGPAGRQCSAEDWLSASREAAVRASG